MAPAMCMNKSHCCRSRCLFPPTFNRIRDFDKNCFLPIITASDHHRMSVFVLKRASRSPVKFFCLPILLDFLSSAHVFASCELRVAPLVPFIVHNYYSQFSYLIYSQQLPCSRLLLWSSQISSDTVFGPGSSLDHLTTELFRSERCWILRQNRKLYTRSHHENTDREDRSRTTVKKNSGRYFSIKFTVRLSFNHHTSMTFLNIRQYDHRAAIQNHATHHNSSINCFSGVPRVLRLQNQRLFIHRVQYQINTTMCRET